MHDVAIRPIRHLFHQDFAETHVHAAFDLAHHQYWINRFADVVRDPDALDCDYASVRVDINLGYGRRVAVGRRWANSRALVFSGRTRRRVRTNSADSAKL